MTAPNGMNGSDVLLLVNTGTDQSPSYTVVGAQRDVSFNQSTDEIDMSSKDSRAFRILGGRTKYTLTMDALYVPSAADYAALRQASDDGALIKVRREEEGVALYEADALITSMDEGFPDQDAATISLEMTIDNGWTELTS